MTIISFRIPEYVIPGKPLGRHFRYDSRNEFYPFRPARAHALAAVLYSRHVPIFDQGQVGSCTGNALVGCAATSPNWEALPVNHPVLNEALALRVYSDAEDIDGDGPYPPNDNGSSGVSAAQAAKNLGLIGGYTHCTDLATMQQAMMERPVAIGINWYDSFDSPSGNGTVSISPGAQVRGGHEIAVVGMDPSTQMFLMDNSWGTSWGYNGTFQFSFSTMTRLLAEQGDCTVPLPDAVTPTPPGPTGEAFSVAWTEYLQGWTRGTRTRADLILVKQHLQEVAVNGGLPL